MWTRAPNGRKMRSEFADVFREIFARHPDAADFDPCPCGITLAVIPRELVKEWHYMVPDDDLRQRASEIITRERLGFSNVSGGVLVICEVA